MNTQQNIDKIKNNFTLIELLVVIAIIAILASMLLPALNKAREVAKQTKCMANMKNHGTAVVMYTDEHDNWLPVSSSDDGGNPSFWRYEISPYIGIKTREKELFDSKSLLSQGVFSCPSWTITVSMSSWLKGGYGWNMEYAGYRENAPTVTSCRQKLSLFSKPSESILAGDTTDWYDNQVLEMATMYHASCSWEAEPPVGNRHKNGINVLWGDGHVSWMSQQELQTGQNGDVNFYYRKDKL